MRIDRSTFATAVDATVGAPSCGGAEDQRLAALDRYDVLDTPREEAFDRITRLACRVFKVPIATVTLVDGHRQWFKSRQGLQADETDREPAFCNVVVQQRGPLVVEDASLDPRFAQNPFVTGEPRIRFYAGAPLISPDGHSLGALCLIDRVPRAFKDDQLASLTDLASIVVDELELRMLARTDALTGAMSRRAFRDEAGRAFDLAARHGHEISLLALDLDHFKSVNDTYGHVMGDAVLSRTVAASMRELRSSDLIARIGGEEFVAMLPHAGGQAALEVAERLRRAIAAETYRAGGATFQVSASIGVATRTRAAPDVDTLLREADAALYIAKRKGRNRCEVARPVELVVDNGARRRVLKSGRILFNRRMMSVDCTIRSLWDKGAGLDVSSSVDLPDQFELSMGEDASPKRCRIVSATEKRVEVEFT